MKIEEIKNPDIYAYALYRMQGTGQFVDVEDIYVECWRLSPSRFGWRTKLYPNYKVASKAQQEFERAHPDMTLKESNGLTRQLTATGVNWVRERLDVFETLASGKSKAPATRRASHKLVNELVLSPLAQKFLSGQRPELSKIGVATLLQCAPDSLRSVWQQRLATLRSAAADNERADVVRFIDYIHDSRREWFE